jgi:hypothetical protein
VGAPLFSIMQSPILDNVLEGLPAQLRQDVVKELATGYHADLVKAEVHQKRIAKDSQQDLRSIDGIGRLRMRIDPTLYHHWGAKLGYECWKDSQFLREVERDNPEVRVKCGGTKLQVGFAPTNTKFSKKY